MKKINTISCILAAGLLLFAACDKIPADQYTSGAGGSSNWENANVHRVYVEKYTGPKCSNCPDADITLDAAHHQFGDRLIIISVNHPVGQGIPYPGQPDLRTDDGTTWDNANGINAIPTAFINRDISKQYSGSMSAIAADIETAINQAPQAGVEVTATATGDSISITVDVEFYRQLSDGLTLTLALTEDSLVYRQAHGEEVIDDYVHNHMLRDVITDVWGNDIPMEGNALEHKVGHFTYVVTDGSIQLENCHIVALLSRKSDRYILNCAECSIQ